MGFGGQYLFERTKISDVLVLFLLGLLLGPVFRVVDTAFFLSLVPFFAPLALMILLFDGGLNMNFFKAVNDLSRAFAFTVLAFVFSVFLAAGALYYLLGWHLVVALLLGAVLGGTNSAIVLSMLSRATGREETKTILSLETVLNDPLTIVTAIVLVQVMASGSVSLQSAGNIFASSFSIAAVAGVAAALAWLKAYEHFRGFPYSYLLALATLMVLYGVVEGLQANGAISALVFGLVLGNASEIAKSLQFQENYDFGSSLKQFHSEISFFVRTFFFVYLGIIFDTGVFSLPLATAAGLVVAALVAARLLAVIVFDTSPNNSQERALMVVMMPRGLAAAVAASLPAASSIAPAKFPQLAFLSEVALLVILATNVLATLGLLLYERKYGAVAAGARKARVVEVTERKLK